MQKSIRYITVGYLTLLVTIKMLALPLLCLQFDLNRDFIASTLCENRDKPQMKCSGKCLLQKNMHASGDMGKPDAQKTNSSIPSIDFCEEAVAIEFQADQGINEHLGQHKVASPMIGFTGKIFHPPLQA